jgi:hypothetical protein
LVSRWGDTVGNEKEKLNGMEYWMGKNGSRWVRWSGVKYKVLKEESERERERKDRKQVG